MSDFPLGKLEDFDQSLKTWVAGFGKDQLFRQKFPLPTSPAPEKDFWQALLAAILGGHFTLDVSGLSNQLANMGGYASPGQIDEILEASLLGLMTPEIKEGLKQTIFEGFSQMAAWSAGEWHKDLTADPTTALREAEDLFLFPSPWETAKFFALLGYPFVYSQGAYQAFLRFAGVTGRLSYYDWYQALVDYFGEHEKARVVDFAWERIFSSNARGILPQLCEEKPDCYPCPLKNNCQVYDQHFSRKAEKIIAEKLAVGKENELEVADLMQFLLKSSFGDTELQRELIASFPKGSNQPFFDIKRSHLDQVFYSRYQAMLALCRKFHSADILKVGASFTSSSQVFEHFRYSLARQKQESFYIVILDQAFKIIRLDEITRGTLDESLVHPREVFAQAIQLRASSLILIHNHPSGTLQPSPEDRQVTSRLIEAGKIIGIKILDHIIVSENGYYSFDEKGILVELKN